MIALTNGTLYTMEDGIIEHGTVLINENKTMYLFPFLLFFLSSFPY